MQTIDGYLLHSQGGLRTCGTPGEVKALRRLARVAARRGEDNSFAHAHEIIFPLAQYVNRLKYETAKRGHVRLHEASMPGLEPFHTRQIRTGERVLGHRVSPRDAATHPPTLIHSALMTPPHSQNCTRPSLRRRAAPLHLIDRADDELDLCL